MSMTAHIRPESGMPDPEPFEQRRRPGSPSAADADPHAAVLPPEAARSALTVEATTPTPNLPPRASGRLVGRESELRAVADALAHDDGGGLVTQATTLHGLGGVGKTSLALHHAYARADHYRLIWWITAESEGQLAEAFAGLAVHLHPSWALTAPPGQQVEWAIAWLRAHDRWLLVYDNAEDPAHLTPYVGRLLGRGHQLVTSRRAGGWHPGIRPVRIDVLDAPEAARLLCGAAYPGTALDPAEQDEARALADELGHLPIALAQAGAYVQQTGTTFAAYRELLRDTGPVGPGAEHTVARLWRTTLRTVQHTAPFAVDLLRTLAWYAPEALPRETLTPFGERRPDEVDRALRLLADYHLITLGDTVTVHRLLQTVLRDSGPAQGFRQRAERHLAEAAARLWPSRATTPGHSDRTTPALSAYWSGRRPPAGPPVTATGPPHCSKAWSPTTSGCSGRTIPVRCTAAANGPPYGGSPTNTPWPSPNSHRWRRITPGSTGRTTRRRWRSARTWPARTRRRAITVAPPRPSSP